MGLSSVAALTPIQSLLLAPRIPAGSASTNLLSAKESEAVLAKARVERFQDAVSARRGTFAPSLIPDDIVKSQRFSQDSVLAQSERSTSA